MKAFLITRTFTDGEKEGVLFTNEDDAHDALDGCQNGSALAVNWTDLYGDDEVEMTVIEI